MAEQTATTAVSASEWETWRRFTTMRSQLDLALERDLHRNADISIAEYSVLIMLFEAPDKQLRANQLGMSLAWEKSRVSHQVSRMEKRGLVERRECDTDARGTWIGLTPGGSRAVLSAMRNHATNLRRYFFDALSADELAAILSAATKVSDLLIDENCENSDS
jgi:DNA-binding MarR family transcriptional regulator